MKIGLALGGGGILFSDKLAFDHGYRLAAAKNSQLVTGIFFFGKNINNVKLHRTPS